MASETKVTEAQIAFVLRQAGARLPVDDVVRELGIRQAIFFRWGRGAAK